MRECAAVGLMSSKFLHMPRFLAESCLCHVCMCVCVFQSVYVCVRAQVITESSTNEYCACGCVGIWVCGCAAGVIMSNMSLHMSWVTRAIMCARKAECVWLEVVTERVMCACVCVGVGVDG